VLKLLAFENPATMFPVSVNAALLPVNSIPVVQVPLKP
jgi:hypothetical protein